MPNETASFTILDLGLQTRIQDWSDPHVTQSSNPMVFLDITRIDDVGGRVILLHNGEVWVRSKDYNAAVGMFHCWQIHSLCVEQNQNGPYVLLLLLKDSRREKVRLACWRTEAAAWYWHDTITERVKKYWGGEPEIRPIGYYGALG